MLSRIEIAYADRRDGRMIIVGAAAWETTAEQEWRFAELPGVEDSDFIADFYDEEGCIAKDKCISAATVETVMGRPIAALIEEGRRAEDDLSRKLRDRTPPAEIGLSGLQGSGANTSAGNAPGDTLTPTTLEGEEP